MNTGEGDVRSAPSSHGQGVINSTGGTGCVDGWGAQVAEAGGSGVVCPVWPGRGEIHSSVCRQSWIGGESQGTF